MKRVKLQEKYNTANKNKNACTKNTSNNLLQINVVQS